jgi:hypothetical protein
MYLTVLFCICYCITPKVKCLCKQPGLPLLHWDTSTCPSSETHLWWPCLVVLSLPSPELGNVIYLFLHLHPYPTVRGLSWTTSNNATFCRLLGNQYDKYGYTLLRQMYSTHTFPPSFFKIHLNIPFMSRSSKWHLPFRSSAQNYVSIMN